MRKLCLIFLFIFSTNILISALADHCSLVQVGSTSTQDHESPTQDGPVDHCIFHCGVLTIMPVELSPSKSLTSGQRVLDFYAFYYSPAELDKPIIPPIA